MSPTSVGVITFTMVLSRRMRPISRSGWASSASASRAPRLPALALMPQPVAVQAHERGFAACEKRREDQQNAERRRTVH